MKTFIALISALALVAVGSSAFAFTNTVSQSRGIIYTPVTLPAKMITSSGRVVYTLKPHFLKGSTLRIRGRHHHILQARCKGGYVVVHCAPRKNLAMQLKTVKFKYIKDRSGQIWTCPLR